jgi:tRNA modification GTPase
MSASILRNTTKDKFAAVMTGKGTGAISTIQLFGDSAEAIIKKIFKSTGTKTPEFAIGKILLGTISDGDEPVDQVTIGCEAANSFAIHCHGNPLIVEMIMQLLQRCGARIVTAEQLLAKTLTAQKSINTIALEAKLSQLQAKTIQGAKIIASQIETGLTKKVNEWRQNIDTMSFSKIAAEADEILKDSQIAKLIIFGCKAAIIGPPNSGKSTLLNCLAGREKAIVTDVKGTTRDWVSATCRIEPLSIEFFDTAGLDEKLSAQSDTIEKAAQKKSVEILEQADLVLLVLDNNQPAEQLNEHLLKKVADKRVLTVLNKSDLPAKFDIAKLPKILGNTVLISAKFGTGIEELIEKILEIYGVVDFDFKTAVCFTYRQEELLIRLKKAKSKPQAVSVITELLNGLVCV